MNVAFSTKNRNFFSRIDPNSKTSKVLEQKFASLGLHNPLKIKIKLMGSKVNSQQAYGNHQSYSFEQVVGMYVSQTWV